MLKSPGLTEIATPTNLATLTNRKKSLVSPQLPPEADDNDEAQLEESVAEQKQNLSTKNTNKQKADTPKVIDLPID